MLSFPPSVRVFVATQAIDGRKGADSLMVIVRDVFRHDPLSGHLFVFFSKRADRVRIVYWDANGFAMWTKRLERGRYHAAFATDGSFVASAIRPSDLALIVSGIDLAGARRRREWEPKKDSHEPLNP